MHSHGKLLIVSLFSILLVMFSFFFGYKLGRNSEAHHSDDRISPEHALESGDDDGYREPSTIRQEERERRVELSMRSFLYYNAVCKPQVDKYRRMVEDVQRWCDPACEDELVECKRSSEEMLFSEYSEPAQTLSLWVFEHPRHFSMRP